VANDRPIAIRALKRFACEQAGPESRPTDEVLAAVRSYVPVVSADVDELAALVRAGVEGAFQPGNGQSIAVIGAGPAGLSAAHDLALMGFRPVVFESEPVPAGMLAVGVPAYRLPRELIAREVAVIERLGVEIRCGLSIGEDISLAQLRKLYAAVIVAVGAKSSRRLGLPGEAGPRVYGGVDLLRAVALGMPLDLGREVVVVGGGNVAYDVARTVVRQIAYDAARTAARLLGPACVHLVSLETLEEMPADTLEILEGDEEGVQRLNGWGPVEIERDHTGNVRGVVFRQCRQVYDAQRKFAPVYDDQVRLTVPCDTVLLSVGQSPNLGFLDEGGRDIEQFRPGWPKVDPSSLASTAAGVFVAGDLAHGTRLLIDAVASGKAAARSVYRYITGREIRIDAVTAHIPLERYRRERGYEAIRRVPLQVTTPEERLRDPEQIVEIGYTPAEAMREASRCLDCGVTPVFDGNRCVLCGGCVDVCPTECLKLVRLSDLEPETDLDTAIRAALGLDANRSENSAILKDEDRCIRCALCAQRCPADAITMERITRCTLWRSA
jgi:NADPH-dependent glutamate synthase beta subunit-like oxidoreductase